MNVTLVYVYVTVLRVRKMRTLRTMKRLPAIGQISAELHNLFSIFQSKSQFHYFQFFFSSFFLPPSALVRLLTNAQNTSTDCPNAKGANREQRAVAVVSLLGLTVFSICISHRSFVCSQMKSMARVDPDTPEPFKWQKVMMKIENVEEGMCACVWAVRMEMELNKRIKNGECLHMLCCAVLCCVLCRVWAIYSGHWKDYSIKIMELKMENGFRDRWLIKVQERRRAMTIRRVRMMMTIVWPQVKWEIHN